MNDSRRIKVQAQTVLYENEYRFIYRSLVYLANAVAYASKNGLEIDLSVVWGDASGTPLLSPKVINLIEDEFGNEFSFHYIFFNKNTGTSYGHNRMGLDSTSDYLLIMNPDIVVQPNFFIEMLHPFLQDVHNAIGIVEARQTPIEHHKEYDVITGETSWGSGACTLFRTKAFQDVQGYDENTFFMYCDDVDVSWRIRLNGYKVIYRPSAVVFHDKRLDNEGKWSSTKAERKYSIEARLLMAWKWCYPEILNDLIKHLENEDSEESRFALERFIARKDNGELPQQIDPEHTIGDLTELDYGPMRF